jgi:Uma2 family endonuclease
MGALPAANRVSIEEYLTNPAYARCEYVDGEPVEINVGGKPHSQIQSNCTYWVKHYLRSNPIGYTATELHCKLLVNGQQRYRLPDASVVVNDESPEQRFLDRAPDIVVEVRSPKDSMVWLIRKMDEYFANGARIGWVVLPEEAAVMVLRPGAQLQTLVGEEILDGGDVLPGFAVPVNELFE